MTGLFKTNLNGHHVGFIFQCRESINRFKLLKISAETASEANGSRLDCLTIQISLLIDRARR